MASNIKAIKPAPAEQYRIKILEDQCEYEHGDYDEGEEGEIQRAAVDRAIGQHGVWGYVVEKLVPATPGHPCKACGYAPDAMTEGWEHVDSCFGFIGNDDDYMLSQALESIPEGYGEVSIVDEQGREINTVTR